MESDLKQHFKDAFSDFIRITTGQKRKFNETVRNNQCIDKLINVLHAHNGDLSGIDVYYAYKYVLYQFHRIKASHELSDGKGYGKFGGLIMVSWVFSKSAFDKWTKKKETWEYVATKYVKSEYDISFDELIDSDNDQDESELIPVYEMDKKRWHNTVVGFAFCQDSLLEFSEKSKYCVSCKFQIPCKKING